MKHLALLTVAVLTLINAQAATAKSAVAIVCNNDGRCIQRSIEAAPRAHRQTRDHVRAPRRATFDANSNRAKSITVPTAAGIDIVVAPSFAGPIAGFIADLKARGVQPRQIHCLAGGGHRPGSLHYRGEACDFDFYAKCMGCSARWTRHVADLASKWGLRNGCSFGDCGHIDSGRIRSARAPWPRTAQLARQP